MIETQSLELCEIAAQAVEEARPRAEAGRIFQLLDNLISNAVEFTPAGGRVDVRVVRGAEQFFRTRLELVA